MAKPGLLTRLFSSSYKRDAQERQRLEQWGIRVEPLPPPLPQRTRRLSVVDDQTLHRAHERQRQCLLFRLPRELRVHIYSNIFAEKNIVIGLKRSHKIRGNPRSDMEEHLFHNVVGPRVDSDHWKAWSSSFSSSSFWPLMDIGDYSSLTTLARTCQAFYIENIEVLYSSNFFLFRNPYPLIQFTRRLCSPRMEDLRTIFLQLDIMSPSLVGAEPAYVLLWAEVFECLASLTGLERLRVNACSMRPCDPELWTKDLTWLNSVKSVTAPSDYQLLIPVDATHLEMDTAPSACRVIGHTYLSEPSVAGAKHLQSWLNAKKREENMI